MQILSYAKINLFFYIKNRREDGFHNILSLMCQIGIYDEILVDFINREKIEIDCDDKSVPDNEGNIVYKAITLFAEKNKKDISCKVQIKKNIPIGAGLGGGSSNAAAILLLLNDYYKKPFSTKELMEIGKQIGADVPFFIFKKNAIAEGIGDKLKRYKVKPYNIIVAYPNINISTKTIYKKVNLELTNNKKKLSGESFYKDRCVLDLVSNDFESIVFKMHPEVQELKKYFLKKEADASLMSGSGSSVFAIFNDIKKAQNTLSDLKNKTNYKVFLTTILD